MVILAIDFGLSRVGLALADNHLAQPLGIIANSSKLIPKILAICRKNKIKKIVIGLPEGKIAEKVKNFGQTLQSKIAFPVEFQDETLTSQNALDMMIKAGKSRKARQQKDAFAAAIILQEYLEKTKNV